MRGPASVDPRSGVRRLPMSFRARMIHVLPAVALAACLFGCGEKKDGPAPAKSAAKAPTASVPTTPKSAPAPTKAVKKPSHACLEGSEGEGTFKEPCVAKGKERMMEVKWTGKITDKGPSFRVINKTKLEILYGQVVVYFYDKKGKQLEVPGGGDKAKVKQKCSGNIFAGPMKPGEKAVLWFSCVNKKHVH